MRRISIAGFITTVAVLTLALAAPTWAQSRGSRGGRVRGGGFSARNVPGLGFDYPHLAAVGRLPASTLSIASLSDGQLITPFVTWAAPYYPYPEPAPQPPAPQPIVIVLQQPAPTVIVMPAPGSAPAAAPSAEALAPPVSVPPAAPLREVGQFILVRRDGQVLFAVAFSTSGDRLIYVTQQGTRHAIPLSQLDLNATREMNDAAGATLILPN